MSCPSRKALHALLQGGVAAHLGIGAVVRHSYLYEPVIALWCIGMAKDLISTELVEQPLTLKICVKTWPIFSS